MGSAPETVTRVRQCRYCKRRIPRLRHVAEELRGAVGEAKDRASMDEHVLRGSVAGAHEAFALGVLESWLPSIAARVARFCDKSCARVYAEDCGKKRKAKHAAANEGTATSEREALSKELQRLGWELGNDGEPRAARRKFPRYPLWTAHHSTLGVIASCSPGALFRYARLVNLTVNIVSVAGYALVRGIDAATGNATGWWLKRKGRGVAFFANGDESDLHQALSWVRAVLSAGDGHG